MLWVHFGGNTMVAVIQLFTLLFKNEVGNLILKWNWMQNVQSKINRCISAIHSMTTKCK